MAALFIICGAAVAASLVSVKEEIEIGRAANEQMKAQVPELRDGRWQLRAEVGRRLARVAPGPDYPYSFSVADRREINGFSLPAGRSGSTGACWSAQATNRRWLPF